MRRPGRRHHQRPRRHRVPPSGNFLFATPGQVEQGLRVPVAVALHLLVVGQVAVNRQLEKFHSAAGGGEPREQQGSKAAHESEIGSHTMVLGPLVSNKRQTRSESTFHLCLQVERALRARWVPLPRSVIMIWYQKPEVGNLSPSPCSDPLHPFYPWFKKI